MSSLRRYWQQALQLLWIHEGPVLTLCNSFLASLEECGQWQRALQFLDVLRGKEPKPDVATYNTALSACAAASCWELALATLCGLEDVQPDAITYNAVITACANAGRWRGALALLVCMRGLKNRISFNTALHACAGSVFAAFEFQDMREALIPAFLEARCRLAAEPGTFGEHGPGSDGPRLFYPHRHSECSWEP